MTITVMFLPTVTRNTLGTQAETLKALLTAIIPIAIPMMKTEYAQARP